jgi:hypothetical protein
VSEPFGVPLVIRLSGVVFRLSRVLVERLRPAPAETLEFGFLGKVQTPEVEVLQKFETHFEEARNTSVWTPRGCTLGGRCWDKLCDPLDRPPLSGRLAELLPEPIPYP